MDEDGRLSGSESFPDLSVWASTVPADHPFVSDGSRLTPLVLDRDNRLLYLHRWYKAEKRVGDMIRSRIANTNTHTVEPEEIQRLEEHFSADASEQRAAVEKALNSPFSIITGGPGTGKTTTIMKLIDLFVLRHGKDRRIAVCAPTGKAVSRLEESIRGQVLASDDQTLQDIFSFDSGKPVDTPITLHRLLGINPVRGTCRYNAENLLPYDLVVLDEASMVDLLLLNQLILALRPDAHLLLVGDKDQLPAVGSGTIFADLCSASRLDSVLGILRKNWRAREAPGIVELSAAVNQGDAELAMKFLKADHDNVKWFAGEDDFEEIVLGEAFAYWDALRRCVEPSEAFDILSRFQVLCAVRRGNFGVNAVNDLARAKLGEVKAYYQGLPIMISANDPRLKLFNGDVGVILNNADGELRAFFPMGKEFRSIGISRLPEHEPVYAMTIHKSQGSEAERVFVILPKTESPILTKELLYTAITRAKKNVCLWAKEAIIRSTVLGHVTRVSGLPLRLKVE